MLFFDYITDFRLCKDKNLPYMNFFLRGILTVDQNKRR